MLEKEFKYYVANQKQLVQKYAGKYVVIVNEKVVGAYDSEPEAYNKSLETYEPGTFFIQFCKEGESSYTQTFNNRVIFA